MKSRTWLAACVLLTLARPAAAQDVDKRPPCAKVVSMSVGKWLAYYARSQGSEETEVTDRRGLFLYGECLEKQDDLLLRRKPLTLRARIVRYRVLGRKLHDDVLSYARELNGGGSMFIEIFGAAHVDDEQFIRGLIARPQGRPAAPRPAQRRRLIQLTAQVRHILAEAAPTAPEMQGAVREVTSGQYPSSSLARLRQYHATVARDFQSIVVALPPDRPQESLLILSRLAKGLKGWLNPMA